MVGQSKRKTEWFRRNEHRKELGSTTGPPPPFPHPKPPVVSPKDEHACNKVAGSSSTALGKAIMRLDWKNLGSHNGVIVLEEARG